MKLRLTPRFEEEARAFCLKRHCDDCAMFDPGPEACVHGFPTTEHRLAGENETKLVVFCKDFELA